MEYLIIGLTAGLIVAFFCMVFYRSGVKVGMSIKNNTPLEPIKNPITAVKEQVEQSEELKKAREDEAEITKQFSSLMNFQPEFTQSRDAN